MEIIDSQEQDTQGSQTRSTGTSRKSARKSNVSPTLPKPTPVKVHIPHKDHIPIWMHDFIQKVTDVPVMAIVGSKQLRSYIT